MALHIIVTVKQVIDPEMPASALRIDETATKVVTPATFPPVVNGFDEYALEGGKHHRPGSRRALSGRHYA